MSDIGQRQEGGDHSINIQGRDISLGLTYGETKEVAMDVFETNFHRLSRVAADAARARAEELLDSYLREMAETGGKEIPEAQNPDFQYALFTAQREYARSGDKDLGGLLVQLLVDRTKEEERNLVQIVLNESLSVAPKLTVEQLDALSLLFIIRYTQHNGLTDLKSFATYLDEFLLPFTGTLSKRASLYQHLEFASCGTIGLGSISITEIWRRQYGALFSKGFSEAEVQSTGFTMERIAPFLMQCLHNADLLQGNCLNDEVIAVQCKARQWSDDECNRLKTLQNSKLMNDSEIQEYVVKLRPRLKALFETWNESSMQHMTLTSVGIAIAHANVQRRTAQSFDLSIWI